MFYPSLSLFSLGLVDSSSRLISAEGAREKRSRGSTRIAFCLSFFFGNANASFSRFTKKNTSQKVFLFCLALERKNTHRRHASSAARATTTTRTTITNARYARARDLFSLPRSLYLFLFVVAYLILISLATVVALTRTVVRLSAFAYERIA